MLKKNFTLHDYQNNFKRNIGIGIQKHKRIIGCAATGSGKTKTFVSIAANYIKKAPHKSSLIITEARKIFDQLTDEVHAIEIAAGNKLLQIHSGNIYVAMAQTLIKRPHLIDQFKAYGENLLTINDEAHMNVATKILQRLDQSLLIGMTATPIGKHLPLLYNEIVIGPQPHELVLDGYLSPYRHFKRQRADLSNLVVDASGDFTEASQEDALDKRIVYDGLIDDLKIIQYKKAMIYCSSINHCERVAEELRAAGLSCVVVHSKCENEAYNLFQFTNGLIPICVSVGILTKGFDYPPCDLIVLMRATTSMSLYLQMIGRGSRLSPETNKTHFTVLDYGGNVDRKVLGGPWDFERDWRTLWRSKPKKPGVPPIKICPNCEFVCAAASTKCPNCGYAFAVLNVDNIEPPPDSILVEVTAKYSKLVGKLISSLTPEELATYANSKNKKAFAIRVAKWHAKNDDISFLRNYGKQMGYKDQWFYHIVSDFEKNPTENFMFKDDVLK